MPAEPARHLHVVDQATGELVPECPECIELKKQLVGMEKDLRAWRTRYANLKRDREADAIADERWGEAVELFQYWQQACNHPKSEWTIDRFELILPRLRKYGTEVCKRAIDGAAFDPYTKRMRNGRLERYDGIKTIFEHADNFERYANRAPRRKDAAQVSTDPQARRRTPARADEAEDAAQHVQAPASDAADGTRPGPGGR